MTTIRHVHLSGRFDVSESEMRNALAYLASQGNLITMTEVGVNRRRAVIEKTLTHLGWHLYHPSGSGRDECLIAWSPEITVTDKTAWRLTWATLKSSRKAPLYAPAVRVNDTWITVAHLPAHLESPRGFKRVWAARVHSSAVVGWHSHLHAAGAHQRVVVADWNINIRQSWVRGWFKSTWPRLTSGWQKPFPGGGTHHRRLIDTLLTNRPITQRSALLKKLPGFDHRPFVTTYTV